MALAQAACRDVSRLSDLGHALNDEYAPTRLGVSLTDQILLTVTVGDSALALASCEAQVAFAMSIGRFLRERYPGLDALQVVTVAFAAGFEREDAQSRAHLPIRFRPAAVHAGLQAQDSTEAVGSCRAFEELNRTPQLPHIGGSMKRVTGIGGIFFKAKDAPALQAWYKRHLAIDVQEWGGTAFTWADADGKPTGGTTVWSVGPEEGDQFAPSKASFMVNYRVEDLHGVVTALKAEGCNVLDKIDDSEYGKFAWVIDPEGNKVELWQPPAGQ